MLSFSYVLIFLLFWLSPLYYLRFFYTNNNYASVRLDVFSIALHSIHFTSAFLSLFRTTRETIAIHDRRQCCWSNTLTSISCACRIWIYRKDRITMICWVWALNTGVSRRAICRGEATFTGRNTWLDNKLIHSNENKRIVRWHWTRLNACWYDEKIMII